MWDAGHRNHTYARERLSAISDDLVFLCPITHGEVEYGLLVHTGMDRSRRDTVRAAMAGYRVVPIDQHTGRDYGAIRAVLFERHAPLDARGRVKSKYVEDLIDRTTGKALGIQENDLWIVAVAVQYDLVLLTGDLGGGLLHALHAAGWTDRAEFWVPPQA